MNQAALKNPLGNTTLHFEFTPKTGNSSVKSTFVNNPENLRQATEKAVQNLAQRTTDGKHTTSIIAYKNGMPTSASITSGNQSVKYNITARAEFQIGGELIIELI